MARDDNAVKGKNKSDVVRFSVLDLLIVVVVLLCVVGIFFRGSISNYFLSIGSSDKIDVGFMAVKVDKSIADLVKEDDSFYIDGKLFASVHNISSQMSVEVLPKDGNEDNELDTKILSDKYDLTGNLVISGRYTDNGFIADGNIALAVGKMLEIEAPGYTLNVIITEIPRK